MTGRHSVLAHKNAYVSASQNRPQERHYLRREVEIELGGGQRRFGGMNVGVGLAQRGAARVEGVDGDRAGLDQRFSARCSAPPPA